jgi:hypothetical protein
MQKKPPGGGDLINIRLNLIGLPSAGLPAFAAHYVVVSPANVRRSSK